MDERTTIAELERRFADSETRYRLLIQSWAQAEWETDAEGVVVADSPSWRAYTGQTLEEWLGYGWLNAIHPDDRAYAEQQWRDATAARGPVDAEFRLRAPDGGWRWTNVRATPMLDKAGNIERWAGINIDIDARKSAETALHASEEKYRTIFDSIDDGFCVIEVIINKDGDPVDLLHLELNHAYERHTGLNNIVGKRALDVTPDAAAWLPFYGNVARTGHAARIEYHVEVINRWFACHASRIGGEGSQKVVVVFNDITDRKRAELALLESEERKAFLLKLSDALRPVTDPLAIQDIAARTLGEHLDADRTYYAVVKGDYEFAVVEREYLRGDVPSVVGTHPFSRYGTAFDAFRNGRTMAVDDTEAPGAVRGEDLPGFRALSIRSIVNTPLVKGGRSVAGMNVLKATPHAWTAKQVSLVEEVAERTWAAVERARAEKEKRASEARYRALFESMDEGYCIIQMIFDDRGEPVDYLFVEANEALERHSGLKDVVGKRMLEMVPDHERKWFEIYGRVAMTGEPIRFEQAGERLPNPSIYELYAFRIGEPQQREVAVLFIDIGPRRRPEQALRESEKRQAFLLNLSDTLRPLTDPIEITAQVTRMLGEYMQADRTFIAMMEPDGVNLDVHHEYLRPGTSSVIGHHNFDSFGAFVSPRLVDGEIMAVEDVATLALTPAERAHYAAVGIAAYLLVPLVRDGRFAACFTCNHQTARRWTEADKNIVRQTADRTWAALERARAEAALNESEERFAQFAASSSDGLWIRNAATLAMEYVSPAIQVIYGVPPDHILGDPKRWAAQIVPEDRAAALEHLEQARRGEAVVHEFRIQRPSDSAFRWIRNTDFPLHDDGRIPRIGGIAQDVTEAKLAAEHSAVLLAELQHRVRNIMALLRSITNRTAERAESVPEYRDLMMGRLLAFARVQALLTRTANVSVGIASIVHDEVSVQAQHESQYVLEGPDVALSPKAAEILTLAIHELATNAVKYGALSTANGKVTVHWSTFEKRGGPWLSFDWTEQGAPARSHPTPDTPRRRGFGSELIEGRIPYELRGRGEVRIEPGGARCHLEFPLQSGASILETGAPPRATVFGGAIDMTGEPDLTGRRVLVVEDDFYLATDAARALRGAGAVIMGPCATEADARAELEERRPDAVVVDINLGPGPSFKLAEALKDHGIPFVFTTGYDAEIIPAEFKDVERLEKPLQPRQIVGAVAKLTTAA